MADFKRRTGPTPTDMYSTSLGRKLVVNGPAGTIAIPGRYGLRLIARR
ncbi:hypothetical protein [Bosea sp. (in: a-proteobacteria)]|nr:hypothetical protein [Bosea sp. (in: a-proteobacteria)]